MELKLIPGGSFDVETKDSLETIIQIAEDLLKEWDVDIPQRMEFYNTVEDFIQRILPQVKNYGLTREQSREFIKVSLNYGNYGTFDIGDNSIIEINFDPRRGISYPPEQLLVVIIHESLHLHLYSRLERDIYEEKFRFDNGEYVGDEKLIQLDEGFANFLHKLILEDFDESQLNGLKIPFNIDGKPEYQKRVKGFNIGEFTDNFNNLYEKNAKKGFTRFRGLYENMESGEKSEIINRVIRYVRSELN